MRYMGIVCLLTVAAGACYGEEFNLKYEKTGKSYGPFEYRDGAEIKIGSAIFQLVKASQEEGSKGGLGDVMRTMGELDQRQKALKKPVEDGWMKILPSGKQSYGDLTWDCHYGSGFISVFARDAERDQKIWAQIFYYPNMTEQERKSFSKDCLGYPAKRFEDKWVWVLVGRTEIRLGLNDESLESDETLDAIVKSFDLEAIKKL